MGTPSHALSRHALKLQLAVVAGAIAAIGLTPPATGKILLIPIQGQAVHGIASDAVHHGAMIVGRGPTTGSLVVYGDRDRLAPSMLRHGVAVIAAPDTSCGSGRTTA